MEVSVQTDKKKKRFEIADNEFDQFEKEEVIKNEELAIADEAKYMHLL